MVWKLKIKKNSPTPIYRQLAEFVSTAIEAGRLKPGDRIPSAVDLARRLGVNKVTVVRAFRELEQRKLLVSRVGRGSFVAEPASGDGEDAAAEAREAGMSLAPELRRSIRRLRSNYAAGVEQLVRANVGAETLRLRGGLPSDAMIEPDVLARLAQEVCRENPERLFRYTNEGLCEFREAVAGWLGQRGYSVGPDQIIATNGSQEAIALLALWAREDELGVVCETPTYVGAPQMFGYGGHVVESVHWDGWASLRDRLNRSDGRRGLLAFTCAEFHNPTGQCLSDESREALVESASRQGLIVAVDDIFRDLRFSGEEQPSVYESLPPSRRILIGSFSKSFVPGLRCGFVAADKPIVDELSVIKRYMNLGGPAMIQAMMARFLRDGYAEHLKRIRPYYRRRCAAVCMVLEEELPKEVTFTRPEGGFQLWVQMPIGYSSVQVYLDGLERGVAISPGAAHDIDGRSSNCFRLGYACGSLDELRRGASLIASAVGDALARGPSEPIGTGVGVPV